MLEGRRKRCGASTTYLLAASKSQATFPTWGHFSNKARRIFWWGMQGKVELAEALDTTEVI